MQKQWSRKSVIAALIVIGALGIVWVGSAAKDTGTRAGTQAAKEDALPVYRYQTVRADRVTLTTELPGRVSAFLVAEVRPQVNGIMTERLFTEGADVVAGQILYQIDPAIYEAAVGNAKATLARAEANERAASLLAARYGKIVKSNAISKQEYDDAVAAQEQAKAEVEVARQALETANINLGYTKINAPVSGRISRSLVTPGALATQHQPEALATIQQLDKVYVDVTHSSSEILKLRLALARGALKTGSPESARARLRLENGAIYMRLPDAATNNHTSQEIEGDLLFSEVTIEQSTGVVAIRALFDNPDKILLPGMYVRAVVEEGISEDAVLVPQKAVMRDTRGRSYVYVLTREAPKNAEAVATFADDNFYVAMRHVQIDRHYNNMWMLSAGLEPGERLLVEAFQKVRPGMVITGLEAVSQCGTADGQAR